MNGIVIAFRETRGKQELEFFFWYAPSEIPFSSKRFEVFLARKKKTRKSNEWQIVQIGLSKHRQIRTDRVGGQLSEIAFLTFSPRHYRKINEKSILLVSSTVRGSADDDDDDDDASRAAAGFFENGRDRAGKSRETSAWLDSEMQCVRYSSRIEKMPFPTFF